MNCEHIFLPVGSPQVKADDPNLSAVEMVCWRCGQRKEVTADNLSPRMWPEQFDAELAELYRGLDGGEAYPRLLLREAWANACERVMQPLINGAASLDETLADIEKIGQAEQPTPEPPKSEIQTALAAILNDIEKILVRQYADDRATLDELIEKIHAPIPE